jgi:hypothetical protein
VTSIIPAQALTHLFSDQDLKMLGTEINTMVTDMESRYAEYFKQIEVWWEWWEATPAQKVKNHPFKNASNIVVPLIRTMCDQAVSSTFNSIAATSERLWIARTENEENRRRAHNVERRINWGAQGNDYDFLLFLYDFLDELYPIGTSVACINYVRKLQPVFFGPQATTRAGVQTANVELSRGPVLTHIPREEIMWDVENEIQNAPAIFRRHRFNAAQLRAAVNFDTDGGWHKENITEVLKDPDADDMGPAASIRARKRRSEGDVGPAKPDGYTVFECHLDWPTLGNLDIQSSSDLSIDATSIPLVVHIHRKTGRVIRATAEPYHIPGKPFYAAHFRKLVNRGHGHGMAKMLEQLQRMETTVYNQGIDAQTRSNAIWGKTTNRRHLEQPIDPAHPIFVNHIDEYQEMRLNPSTAANMALMNSGQTLSERLLGIGDPNFGRDTRQGGHPSPAASTMALLRQGEVMGAATELLMKNELSRMGRDAAILIQQFETNEDGRLQSIFGDNDATEIEEYLAPTNAIPGNYQFSMVAFSRNDNPDTAMRRAVTVTQITNNFWTFVLQGAQVLDSQEAGPQLRALWPKAIETMTTLYERFLTASNVDDMEKFIDSIREIGTEVAQSARQLTEQPGAVAPTPGAVGPAGPPGGANGGVPSGAASLLSGQRLQ